MDHFSHIQTCQLFFWFSERSERWSHQHDAQRTRRRSGRWIGRRIGRRIGQRKQRISATAADAISGGKLRPPQPVSNAAILRRGRIGPRLLQRSSTRAPASPAAQEERNHRLETGTGRCKRPTKTPSFISDSSPPLPLLPLLLLLPPFSARDATLPMILNPNRGTGWGLGVGGGTGGGAGGGKNCCIRRAKSE